MNQRRDATESTQHRDPFGGTSPVGLLLLMLGLTVGLAFGVWWWLVGPVCVLGTAMLFRAHYRS